MLLFSVLLMFCLSSASCGYGDDDQQELETTVSSASVKISLGEVIGSVRNLDSDKVVYQFLSIPYAEAPVGHLRFRKPKQLVKFPKPQIEAKSWSHGCPQHDSFLPLTEPYTPIRSEDCLYLNIWSPNITSDESNLKPVMIYIHGGDFSYGSSNNIVYDGSILATRGDLVIVTMNYRLGVLGFLYTGDEAPDTPEDNEDNSAPGNMGLWDQVMAIEFIKDHIRYFGGDPNQITLAGHDAGATSVSLHMLSSVSSKLFTSGVMISGSSMSPYTIDTKNISVTKARKLASHVNCLKSDDLNDLKLSQETLKCLRELDVDQFIQISNADIQLDDDKRIYKGLSLFQPIYGDVFMPTNPSEMIRDNEISRGKRMIYGLVDFEGGKLLLSNTISSHSIYENPWFLNLFKQDSINKWRDGFKSWSESYLVDPKVSLTQISDFIDVYLKKSTTIDDRKRGIYNFWGDYMISCPVLLEAEKYSSKNDVRQVVFTFKTNSVGSKRSPGNKFMSSCPVIKFGNCHLADLIYFWGRPLLSSEYFNDDEINTSREMIDLIIKFVRNDQLNFPSYGLVNDKKSNSKRVSFDINGKDTKGFIMTRFIYDYKSIFCSKFKKFLIPKKSISLSGHPDHFNIDDMY